ncbi:MAG: CehA/McbA family metallohydrolase [Candidatus Euphemobacter frigidus]|nr:CehA/McbA family metallohydrolase [Candidatus Euphemobacter frigidus]MDP8275412.1 CehA/McbA family metallohydrolase [Candidatus Euphemobacter frigidus]
MEEKHSNFNLLLIAALILFAGSGCGERSEEEPVFNPAGPEERRWVPEIVPYLDAKPSAVDGQGTAEPRHYGPYPVGSRQDFEINFTIGEAGIAPGGFVFLQISPWWGWSEPQTGSPGREGYVEVRTSFSDPPVEVEILPLNRVMVFSRAHPLPSGGVITFIYRNARVDRFAETEELFQFFTDVDGDGHSACIAAPPTITTVAREPVRLNVTVPSQAAPGGEIEVRAAPLDGQGNWSECPSGSYRLMVTLDGKEVLQDVATRPTVITTAGGEKTISFRYLPDDEGIYFFSVTGPSGLQGRSNVLLCEEGKPALRLHFGDIHGHSRLSDGTGTPEDYYRYARKVSGFEISALTDHAAYGTIPIKGAVWDRIKRAANEAYQPGRFVTFVAFEWTNWRYGHRNVYYRDGDGPIFRSIDPESDTPQKLWDLIEPYQAMTIAHHVGGGPIATDWDIPPTAEEWLVEISSIHGSSEYYGCEACIYRPVRGSFVRDALARGYKLGIIGSGDNHDGHPGDGSIGAIVTGVMGVYSTGLTREEIWDAFRKRQVYGTSGPKIILNFRVADSPMGSEVDWAADRGAIPVGIRAVGCDEIDRVEVIRNGEVVFSEKGEGVFARYLLQDASAPAGTSWYYVKVIQKDGQMAWSSPVWVTVK